MLKDYAEFHVSYLRIVEYSYLKCILPYKLCILLLNNIMFLMILYSFRCAPTPGVFADTYMWTIYVLTYCSRCDDKRTDSYYLSEVMVHIFEKHSMTSHYFMQ
jgi:hypothetical protein